MTANYCCLIRDALYFGTTEEVHVIDAVRRCERAHGLLPEDAAALSRLRLQLYRDFLRGAGYIGGDDTWA